MGYLNFDKGFLSKIGLKLSVLIFGTFVFAFLVATFSGAGATTPRYAGADISRPGILGTVADFFDLVKRALADNVTSTVIVGNATPTITSLLLNDSNAITLLENSLNLGTASTTVSTSTFATTTVTVSYTYSDNNGCSDVFTGGSSTILLYRTGVGSSSCLTTPNNLNCYRVTTTTANSCTGSNVSGNATATFGIYFFAQPTDSSSSFSGQGWKATVIARDASNATGTADSASSTLNTLVAITISTSSINYGTVSANSDTGATNQITTSTNSGNSTTTILLKATAALTKGADSIATSSQRYNTLGFTYPGTSTALTASDVAISGVTLASPTSTTLVVREIYWGVSVSSSLPTGTYTGINAFTASYAP